MRWLFLLALIGCKTQPMGRCFESPYLTIDPTFEMRTKQDLIGQGIHGWSSLGAQVHILYEPFTKENEECFNMVGITPIPMYLHTKDGNTIGLFSINDLTGSEEIWIDDEIFYNGEAILPSLIMHEVGHALGLMHVFKNKDSIMYPTLGFNNHLTDEDIHEFERVWGKL